MPRLVLIDGVGDTAFVDALRRAWDAGDAVAVVDPRLPPAARAGVVAACRPDEPVEDGDALVVATSGSTGTPKAVVLTHDAVRASAAAGNARVGVHPATDRWLACLPLAHMGGLNVVLRALLSGTPLDVLPRPDPAAVDRSDATLVSLVPAVLPRVDASRWRRILLGGAAPPVALPSNVVTTYGLTETCGGCVYDGVPLDGVEVRIAAGGEIEVRGPVLLRCYRDGHDPRTADGWLPTGDAGHLDGDGRLHVDGRVSDLVVTGGENVWPAAVEACLRTHPGVAEVAVAGRPDPEWGERVVAWVVPVDAAAPPTLESARDHVKATLPPWCAPRELVVVTDLPRTPSGKVLAPPGP